MRRFIELFAGCGGMSLGLQSKKFELVLANELSPMAAETFAFNHLGIDLTKPQMSSPNQVSWLSSAFAKSQLKERLRENPYETTQPGVAGYHDIQEQGIRLGSQLVVGSVIELNDYLENAFQQQPSLKKEFEVDLVSGGPPCQSFSMAGLRQRNNHRNSLPWEFARFVDLTRPKVVLLENVSGILRAFKDDNIEYHAWREVAKAFASIGYAPICIHANAKYVGVPQNRPRFLMFALRLDVLSQLLTAPLNGLESEVLRLAKESLSTGFNWDSMKYWDVANDNHASVFSGTLFSSLRSHPDPAKWVTSQSALQDLETKSNAPAPKSAYVKQINELFGRPYIGAIPNSQHRRHGRVVQQRFRVYQVLEKVGIRSLFKAITSEDDEHKLAILAAPLLKEEFLFEGVTLRRPKDADELVALFDSLRTKKHSQRALVADKPAPAALSIPDDCCHYSPSELRTLSVREVARLQSFPDSFEFRSKVTTGGDNRKFEVPQYTQAGNAVPPLLAHAAGTVVERILQHAESSL